MASPTVKIDQETHAKLRQTAAETGEPMIQILAKAVDAYRRRMFLEGLNGDFASLRADPEAWKAELAERSAWDSTLADDQQGD